MMGFPGIHLQIGYEMLAAKDGFQAGQTAKARLGPPCAVTPERDMAAKR